ncbi:hypothetical protein DYH09_17480 [bacterium CPR1]|nr:hypothetical protein [bacterium CPR1]
MDLLRALKLIRRHKTAFLAVSLLSLLVVVLLPRKVGAEPTVFTSSAKILIMANSIEAPSSDGVLPGNSLKVWFADQVTLQELVTSENLLKRVLAKLNLDEPWTSFRGRVTVAPLSERNANIYILSVSGETPIEAEKCADTLSTEFVEYVQELSSKEFASTRRYLEELMSTADLRIKKTEAALEKMRQTLPSDQENELLAKQRIDIEAENQILKGEIRTLQQEAQQLEAFVSGASTVPPWQIVEQNSPAVASLSEGLAQERSKLLELQTIYAESNSQVVDQTRRVADLEELYLGQVKKVAQSLLADRKDILGSKESILQANNARLKTLWGRRMPESERLKLERLQRQLDMYQESYLQLVKQLNEARVAELSSRRQGAISILERPIGAVASGGGKQSSRMRDLALAIPLCLVLGVGAAFLADYLQSSMRLVPRIEEMMELPVLAVIPEMPPDVVDKWSAMKQQALTIRSEEKEG